MAGKGTSFNLPGRNFGVGQLTHDPTVRHWANYHNVESFSPDGRYICYATYATDKTVSAKLAIPLRLSLIEI
ncbi:MAG: hypothetical protein CMO80_03035 [Verrucomicrobiales bacterium]|nr:hypothetical protein [Verrucomicrobiales bacterium]